MVKNVGSLLNHFEPGSPTITRQGEDGLDKYPYDALVAFIQPV